MSLSYRENKMKKFSDFWPLYLSFHQNTVCRGFHFAGTLGALICLTYALVSRQWKMLLLVPLIGYGLAWIGHFIFEKNRPAAFRYPFWSLVGDLKMFFFMITGKL